MALSALLFLALLTPDETKKAPEPEGLNEAGRLLRTAWASQYEWKEHEVETVSLGFSYRYASRGKEEDASTTWEGRGELLVRPPEENREEAAEEGRAPAMRLRLHLPGRSRWERATLRGHVETVLACFRRRPFPEEFEGATFEGPDELARGVRRVTAGGRIFLLKDDRIVGSEAWRGGDKERQRVRIDYTTGPVGGGYGILGSSESYKAGTRKTKRTSLLEVREGKRAPAPGKFTFREERRDGELEVVIEFDPPEFDAEHAVVLEPAARDALKEAWARRFTLPEDIRIEGRFEREPGKGTWLRRNVEGEFQIWGMDKIDAVLDERGRKLRNAEDVRRTCRDHLIEGFAMFHPRPFEEEFDGCGFRLGEAEDDDRTLVHVVGHPERLAFRLEDGAIVGRLDLESPETWLEYRVKKERDGTVRIRRIEVEHGDKKHRVDFRYGRSRGLVLPRRFGLFLPPGSRRGGREGGVVHYELSRVKASVK